VHRIVAGLSQPATKPPGQLSIYQKPHAAKRSTIYYAARSRGSPVPGQTWMQSQSGKSCPS
jgi:hypothetical protein